MDVELVPADELKAMIRENAALYEKPPQMPAK